ncbi:hypothetical protein P618_200255 [Holospora obtusa F1]|uniref:Uncharacterized protein n=1 Tax=Holospora obtusa F1 TaxID=1399147 RepID=W6TEC6_HOLOB|nr:hypothetical protein P618_200255 [Holospora obtusa F1]
MNRSFRRLPEEKNVREKDLTFSIESTHSDILYGSVRFKRKKKLSSRSHDMLHKTMKLSHYLQNNPKNISLYMTELLFFG